MVWILLGCLQLCVSLYLCTTVMCVFVVMSVAGCMLFLEACVHCVCKLLCKYVYSFMIFIYNGHNLEYLLNPHNLLWDMLPPLSFVSNL